MFFLRQLKVINNNKVAFRFCYLTKSQVEEKLEYRRLKKMTFLYFLLNILLPNSIKDEVIGDLYELQDVLENKGYFKYKVLIVLFRIGIESAFALHWEIFKNNLESFIEKIDWAFEKEIYDFRYLIRTMRRKPKVSKFFPGIESMASNKSPLSKAYSFSPIYSPRVFSLTRQPEFCMGKKIGFYISNFYISNKLISSLLTSALILLLSIIGFIFERGDYDFTPKSNETDNVQSLPQ